MGLLPGCLSFRSRFRLVLSLGLLAVAAFSISSLSYSVSYRVSKGASWLRPPATSKWGQVDAGKFGEQTRGRKGQPLRPFTPKDPPPLPAALRPQIPGKGKADDGGVKDVVGPPPADPPVGHPAFHNPGAPFDPPPTGQDGGSKAADKLALGQPLSHADLLQLPILHHPAKKERPIPRSDTPWDSNTQRGAKVLELLSADRFPFEREADSLAWKGMLPPKPPRWPDPASLLPRAKSFDTPIALEDVYGVMTAKEGGRAAVPEGEDWWERPKRSAWDPSDPGWKPKKLPKVQWGGFRRKGWESEKQRKEREERREWIRRGFAHVWEGYKRVAWGHDELRPISGSTEDPFSGWGATLVDTLDTLLIMNMTREYNYARTHVRSIDWSHTVDLRQVQLQRNPLTRNKGLPAEPTIPFFETVIRYVGGLLGAYDLSGDELMLKRVDELAQWLMPAFGTSSGFPGSRYSMGTNPKGAETRRVVLAEVGSLSLEFTRLAQLTGKGEYFHVVQRITDVLDSNDWKSSQRVGSLFPTYIDPEMPSSLGGLYTFGAMSDSYYEYLIKEHQLLGGTIPQYGRMYGAAVDSAREHLVREVDIQPVGELERRRPRNFTVLGDVSWGQHTPRIEHLACFAGGMFALGGKLLSREPDVTTGEGVTDSCVWSYEVTPTGVGSEWMNLFREEDRDRWTSTPHEGQVWRQIRAGPVPGVRATDGRYLGRPETIESVLYMWRTTGDRQWQDRGWRMFVSWMEAAITPHGFADISSVHAEDPILLDKEESFVLAETFKYYYLLFSDPDFVSLDDFVFNTEAHPLRIPKASARIRGGTNWKTASDVIDPPYTWEGEEADIEKLFNPPSKVRGGKEAGWGTFIQLWAKTDPNEVESQDLEAALRNRPAPAPLRQPKVQPPAVAPGQNEGVEVVVRPKQPERPAWAKKKRPRPPPAPAPALPIRPPEDDDEVDAGRR